MLVVVGGHSRNIGKTSVAAGLIRRIPEARWTAVKITQYGHGVCSTHGEPCDCTLDYEHPYAISLERESSQTDSGRFLGAGAVESYWLRTPVGQLGNALPRLRSIIEKAENTILESNSALQFFLPDLYLMVLDYSVSDMKESARRFLDRADGFVVVPPSATAIPWEGVPPRWIEGKPRFWAAPPEYVTEELATFVRERLASQREGAPQRRS